MPTLVSISVAPSSPFILTASTQLFIATAHFSDASTLDVSLNPTTAWSSSQTSIATISNTGPSKGTATSLTLSGSTIISATYGGQTGTAILRVGLANYTRILEQAVDGVKRTETTLTAAHNPIARMTTPNFSMFSGGVTMQNSTGSSGGTAIGWTLAMGHPGDAVKLYVANEEQQDGYWVQQNSGGYATISFNNSQRSLGVVTSIPVDTNGNQLTSGGAPVLVQYSGEAYVFTNDNTIVRGSFLVPDANGLIKSTTFDPMNPTAIIGYSLESYNTSTYPDMILMRIQLCGE